MSDPVQPSSDAEIRPLVERALDALYELDCEIGRGGMGIVYRAKDRRLKRTVAIKVLPPELGYRADIKSRFLREAQTAAQLNHPNIVDIYSVDEAGQLVYFVMAYVLGETLAKRVHDVGPLGIEESRRILRDVADALAYAHERGVIHRDIKPDNILIDAESGRPMVTDFGIARAMGDGSTRLTVTGQLIGTPEYMSPEQAGGDPSIDGRSDLYSLGVVAYQMLVGQPPFTGNSGPAILVKHLQMTPVPVQQLRSEIPPDFADIVMKLLAKDPAARYASAGLLVTALDGVPVGGPTPSYRTSGRLSVDPGVAGPAAMAGYSPRGSAGEEFHASTSVSAHGKDYLTSDYTPTPEERARWQSPAVVQFRNRANLYLYVNGAILLLALLRITDLLGVTGIYTVWIVWKYGKLTALGYDWRDAFRQPPDRDLIDVATHWMETLRMLADPKRRALWLKERQARKLARRGVTRLPAGQSGQVNAAAQAAGARGEDIRRAFSDRDEILRILDRLSPSARAQVPNVEPSARVLADKVQALALSLADLDRNPNSADSIQQEISRLEADANPLDEASDTRVRRLAYLRRELRKSGGGIDRRKSIEAKLGDCSISLQNMKLDLLRLSAGTDTHHRVTSLALQAMALADSVDGALQAAQSVADLSRPGDGTARSGTRPTAR